LVVFKMRGQNEPKRKSWSFDSLRSLRMTTDLVIGVKEIFGAWEKLKKFNLEKK